MKTSWEGAQTTLHAVLTEDLTSGGYYVDCAEAKPLPRVLDEKEAQRLYDASKEAVGL